MKITAENAQPMTDDQLAGYFRDRLNFALALACQAERDRRSGRRKSAAACHRRWAETMEEVKRLAPLVRQREARASEAAAQLCALPASQQS